jgi:orotate phosphoribosyltransferase
MPNARQELVRLLAQKSFRLGEFKLSSGGTSDYYVDCRTSTLDALGSRLTGEVFLEEIRARGWRPQAVGGLTMGADPIVVAVAVVSGEISGFLIRKSGKEHGTGQRIEGFREKGARVVIVDDVCTTGASTIQAIEAARDFGFEVVGVMCLVEREEAKGRPNVQEAAGIAPFVSIFRANDVRQEHVRLNPDAVPVGTSGISGGCELCGQPAVTNVPRSRCAAHQV